MRALDWIMLLAAMFLMFQTSVVSEKPTVKNRSVLEIYHLSLCDNYNNKALPSLLAEMNLKFALVFE